MQRFVRGRNAVFKPRTKVHSARGSNQETKRETNMKGIPPPTQFSVSWNAAHMARSCSQPDLIATAGNGLFYCFAQ